MAVDSFSQSSPEALNDLDPLSRALIELSVKRGMGDEEIAEILGTDADSVREDRIGLLRSLAQQVAPEAVDADLPELEAAVASRLYGEEEAVGEEPVAEEPATEEPVDDRPTGVHTVVEPEPQAPTFAELTERERKRPSPLAVLLPLVILAALVGVIVLISGGDDSDDSPAPATQQPADSGADKPQRVRLEGLGGSRARGTATVDGNRLRLRITGLPKGAAYEVWLYDSVIDARSLGRLNANGALRAKLPANARGFKSLDVSREPADGNANHSGQSVLRVPVEKLAP